MRAELLIRMQTGNRYRLWRKGADFDEAYANALHWLDRGGEYELSRGW